MWPRLSKRKLATCSAETTEVACAMAGHSKKESIPLDDIKAVRSCGRKVVEHYRHLAIEV